MTQGYIWCHAVLYGDEVVPPTTFLDGPPLVGCLLQLNIFAATLHTF